MVKIFIIIICDAEMNSFDTIPTFEGMKWNERSSKTLLKKWSKREKMYLEKMSVKIMINILSPLWLASIKGGGKKCKIEIIYLQKYTSYRRLNFKWCNKFGMCLKFEGKKKGRNVVQNIF